MRMTFCGTGSGGVTAKRAASCVLLDDGAKGILLDCGPGALGAIFRAGLPIPNTRTLILSHLHMDHVHGFPAWLAHLVFPYGKLPVVYGPPGTRAYIDAATRATSMVTSIAGQEFGGPLDVPVVELADGSERDIDGSRLRSIVVPHAPEVVAMAHRLEFGGRTVAYSGDTRADASLMVPLAEGADVLIHEAYSIAGLADWTANDPPRRRDAILQAFERTHSQVDAVAKIARDAGVPRLVLTHLNPGEQAERLVAEAAEYYPGEIVAAYDGMALEV